MKHYAVQCCGQATYRVTVRIARVIQQCLVANVVRREVLRVIVGMHEHFTCLDPYMNKQGTHWQHNTKAITNVENYLHSFVPTLLMKTNLQVVTAQAYCLTQRATARNEVVLLS